MLKIKSLLFIVFFIGVSYTPIQDPFPSKVAEALKKYIEEFPQEKIYLHTDHPYYLAGETIWFNAYVTAGSFHQLSPISSTIYVELINNLKEKVHHAIIRVENGVGHGDISLPGDLKTGNYLLRSYSNWMRNFDEAFFFEKELKIWNLDEENPKKALREEKPLDLQFFPEGGNLIAGVRSKIAFKSIGSDGLGKEVDGKIINEKGEVVTSFSSSHMGMGFTSFEPKQNEKYFAEITSNKRYPLPEVLPNGFVVTVTNKPDQPDVVVKVQCHPETPQKQLITLAAHSRGSLGFAAQTNLSANLFIIKIPKSKLAHGLSHITLFDGAGTPRCNRLVYVDKSEKLQLKINGLKANYEPREKVEFEIEANVEGQPVAAHLSMAITSGQEVLLEEHGLTIENYLLLRSELRGTIEAPGYYFDEAQSNRLEALDILLLTQGWTRFDWKELLNNQWPIIKNYIEQGINIQGSLVDNFTKKPVEGGKVTYVSTDETSDIKVVSTGNEGRFILDDLVFYDSSQVVLQGENKKGKKFVEFKLDEILPVVPVNTTIQPLFSSMSEYEKEIIAKGMKRREIDLAFNFDQKVTVLEAMEIKGQKIDPDRQSRIYAGASKTIKASKFPGVDNLFHPLELLRGTPGVRLSPNPPGYTVVIRGVGTFSGATTPYILLDNVPINIETLNTIPVSSIESIDVFSGADAAIFGSVGANGAIAIFTKKGGSTAGVREGVFNFNLIGYAVPQQFYVPKYDVAKPEHVKPDQRATIFWAPEIKTDSLGKAKISFYNPDPESKVDIVIEGITKSGLMGRSNFNYELKGNN